MKQVLVKMDAKTFRNANHFNNYVYIMFGNKWILLSL